MPMKTLCLEANAPWVMNRLDDRGKGDDGGVTALCPACRGVDALSLEMFEGRLRAECRAGCGIDAISDALDLPPRPSFEDEVTFEEWLDEPAMRFRRDLDTHLLPIFRLIARSPKMRQAEEVRRLAEHLAKPVSEVRSAFKAATKAPKKDKPNRHRREAPAFAAEEAPHGGRAPPPPCSRYYVLDNNGYVARIGGRWCVIQSKHALRQHMVHDDGVSLDDAKAHVEELPPAEGLVFEPARAEAAWRHRGRIRINTWYGLPTHKPPTVDLAGYLAIQALFQQLFGQDLDWALDWIARPLQSLATGRGSYRNHTAIVLYGAQGTGKGWFSEVMAELYGEHFNAIQHHVLESQFVPGYLSRSLLLFCDEVASNSMTSDLKVLDRLKLWITEDQNTEQLKFKDADAFRFHFNAVFASNHAQPLIPEETDRRYAFFEQSVPLAPAIVAALVKEKAAGWPCMGRLLAYVLERPVERCRPPPPQNAARKTQLVMGARAYQAFCEELLDVGLVGVSAEWVREQERKEQGSITWHTGESNRCVSVPVVRMNQLFEWWCRNRGYKGSTAIKLGLEMQRRIPGCCHRLPDGEWPRARVAGVRARCIAGVPFRGREEHAAETGSEPGDGFFQ